MSNFSEEFTQLPPTDSPAVVPPNYDKIFKGYSYIAPSVLFTKNVISDEILRPAQQHDNSKLMKCKLNNSPFFQQYDIDWSEPMLGDGTFSVCQRCVHLKTKKEYAVKIVSKKRDCSQEINLLRACQGHPNIVTLHDVLQDDAHTYLILEYLKGGELFDRIRNKSKFTEGEASGIMRKLVSAVGFMHSRGVVHRDLKPENLVLSSHDNDAEIKVIDFGFARLKQEREELHTPCFTLHYAAPEVLKGDPSGYNENCDLWSLGVILYTMLSGEVPFHARSQDEHVSAIMNRIKEGDFNFNSNAWNGVSNEAKSIVRGLLTVDPSQRLRMMDLEINSWIQGNQHFASTPLMTPDVLLESAPEKSLQTTFDAFYKAQREGFRLQEVCGARLAQRRRMKKSSSENNSRSSSFTSGGSIKSRPTLSIDAEKTDDTVKVNLPETENVFNFCVNRVNVFLDSMSSNPSDPGVSSPARISESSVKCDELRASSSSIVLPDTKNCSETIIVRRRNHEIQYVEVRRSERIRRRQRREIDLDPIEAPMKISRKRKYNKISDESSASPNKRKSKKSKVSR